MDCLKITGHKAALCIARKTSTFSHLVALLIPDRTSKQHPDRNTGDDRTTARSTGIPVMPRSSGASHGHVIPAASRRAAPRLASADRFTSLANSPMTKEHHRITSAIT